LSPQYDAGLGHCLGVPDPERSSVGSDRESIQLRPLTSYGNSSCLTMLGSMPLGQVDPCCVAASEGPNYVTRE
jgi:hypothetical protein